MSNKQQEDQDCISWPEELRNISDDASIEDMTTPDLLRVIYVTGIRNNKLRNLVRVAPDCNRSYCEDSFSGYSGSV